MEDEGPQTAGLWHTGLSLVGLLNLILLARLGAAVDHSAAKAARELVRALKAKHDLYEARKVIFYRKVRNCLGL